MQRGGYEKGGSIKKVFLICSCLILLLSNLHGASPTQPQAATLVGRWQIEFTRGSEHHRVQFDGQASGEGSFLVLEPGSSSTLPATPTKAAWNLKGQSPAIFLFTISGDVEFPLKSGGVEAGKLELSASSDLTLPIAALRGWGQFHSSRNPRDGRGGEDPVFEFTATRFEGLIIQVVSPLSPQKLKRGKDVRIEWEVQTPFPLASQDVLVSLDGGDSFAAIAPSLGGEVRSFTWTLPDTLPKTKRAFIKIVATDIRGGSAEAMSAGALRIK